MAERKPLVLGDGAQLQQLQSADDLDIPLTDRVSVLEENFRKLVMWLGLQGLEVPPELLE